MGDVDWGHGPNTPVLMWTEEQIREVMNLHRPVQEGDCLCAWQVHSPTPYQDFTPDHFVDKLKESRR